MHAAVETARVAGIELSPAFGEAVGHAIRKIKVAKAFFLVSNLDQDELVLVDREGRFTCPTPAIDVTGFRDDGWDALDMDHLRTVFPEVDGRVEAMFLDEEWGEFEADVYALAQNARGRP